eukprot:1148729-Pelagomonas_calceolata.AAC.4
MTLNMHALRAPHQHVPWPVCKWRTHSINHASMTNLQCGCTQKNRFAPSTLAEYALTGLQPCKRCTTCNVLSMWYVAFLSINVQA